LRTIIIILVLAIAATLATVSVAVSRVRQEVTQRIDQGYRPRAEAFSSTFTDALWAQVERQTPVVLDRSVGVVSLLLAAATGRAHSSRGFLVASVAARSLALLERHPDDTQAAKAVVVFRELLRTEALLDRYDVDTLTAIYAESAPFGGGMVGLDVAARHLFGKPAALLDANEAASLLTLSWSPNRCDLERLRERRNGLLAKMQSMQLAPVDMAPAGFIPAVLPLMAACHP
jgi:membrane carboxypeptidase/penicillin-binding protein PbpC